MAVNKVIYNGETKLDLTSDTVTPDTLLKGVTAHDASGELIVGTMDIASQFVKHIFSSSTFSLNASGTSTITISASKDGYTPIACIGVRSMNDSRLTFYRWEMSNDTVTVAVRNNTTGKLNNMQLSAQVLFVKNI